MKAAASVLSSMFSFISLMIMTRFAGYEYGVMMWGWSLVGLVNIVADLGFSSANVKFISENRDQNACISTYIVLKIVLVSIMMIMMIAYIVVSVFFLDGFTDERMHVLLVFLAYYIISDFVWVIIYSFDGRMEAGKSSIAQSVEGIIRSLSLVVLALFGVSAAVLSFGYIVGMISAGILSLIMFRNLNFKFTKPIYLSEYFRFVKPIAIGLLLLSAISFTDKVIIGYYYGTDAVGFYNAAMGAIYAMTAIGVALNFILLPKLSELSSKTKSKEMTDVLWSAQKYLTLLFLPASIILAFFGQSVAEVLFGHDFAASGVVLSILAPSIYLNIMIGVFTQILYAMNRTKLYRNAAMIYAVTTFILLYLLISPSIGSLELTNLEINGAAIAMTCGFSIFLIMLAYYSEKVLKGTIYPGMIKHFFAAFIMAAVIVFLTFADVPGILFVIISMTAGMLSYISVLWITKELNITDIRFLMDSVNPKKLIENIKKEMK